MHILCNSSTTSSNVGDRGEKSGYLCGTLDGKGHEEAGDVLCLDLGGSYMGIHIRRNSLFCTQSTLPNLYLKTKKFKKN